MGVRMYETSAGTDDRLPAGRRAVRGNRSRQRQAPASLLEVSTRLRRKVQALQETDAGGGGTGLVGAAAELLQIALELADSALRLSHELGDADGTGGGMRSHRLSGGSAPGRSHNVPQPHPAVFCREGALWTVSYDGHTIRLKNNRGLAYIAHLLGRPEEKVHAVHIVAQARVALRQVTPPHDSVLTTAVAECRERLAELRADLSEAEENSDEGRGREARARIEAVSTELLDVLGRGERQSEAHPRAERARLNVSRGIAAALKKIDIYHPSLATHLRATLRTGTFCIYQPDPRVPLRWRT